MPVYFACYAGIMLDAFGNLLLGTSQLCQHNFKHNRSLKALSIIGYICKKSNKLLIYSN